MSDEPKRKPTAQEVLDAIEESDADDEAERILGLSDEALDRELAEAGFDPAVVRRRGRELAEQFTQAPTGTSGVSHAGKAAPAGPRRRIASRWGVALLAAAVGAAAVGVTVAVPDLLPKRDARPVPMDAASSATAPPLSSAGPLRDQAMRACDEHQWRACLEGLNAARALDPDGDADERVQATRRAALLGIAQESEGGLERK
jgi:hypothetical protein